jgi:hypothetical protein
VSAGGPSEYLTGLVARIVALLGEEVMGRLLDGRINGEAATAALATLNDRWTPPAEANAEWCSARSWLEAA